MPTPSEHKTVQARILKYAEAIGWTFVPREQAEQRRGFDPDAPTKDCAKGRSLFFDDLLDAMDPDKKSKEIEIKLIARLRKHKDTPKFVALGERLEKLKEKHEQGLLHSLDFLKELLTLAKEVVQAEKHVDPVDEQAKAKAALTELFTEVKSGKTPMMIERIVADIDEIVRLVRFPGWQNTKAGEREVQKALRKVIYVKYQVKDQDLFDKAFRYIRQYY